MLCYVVLDLLCICYVGVYCGVVVVVGVWCLVGCLDFELVEEYVYVCEVFMWVVEYVWEVVVVVVCFVIDIV